jgi:predicted sulfurtransferase
MLLQISKILLQAVIVVVISALVALSFNVLRPNGIPVIATAPYEIFSECKDSSVTTTSVNAQQVRSSDVDKIFVDARPNDAFIREHVERALNVPYSVLFGAAAEDIEKVKEHRRQHPGAAIVVYGVLDRTNAGQGRTDVAKPLADQLMEAGLTNVQHLAGGIVALKKAGARTVKGI